ncbi:MAG: phosphopantothenoylcysteine decarboxylase [Planctomycetia bacterium]
MNILITSGGTKTPIDAVRWIGNVSTGRFGAALAVAWLERGATVTLLHAADAVTPHVRRVDLRSDVDPTEAVAAEMETWREYRARYTPIRYDSYDDYAVSLEQSLRGDRFDVVFAAAAVSDFAAVAENGKLNSWAAVRSVELHRTRKLIASVRDWAPRVFLVGFKLLVGATTEELIAAGRAANHDNRADATCANDLSAIRAGVHCIQATPAVGETVALSRPCDEGGPAVELAALIAQWYETKFADR